MRAYADTYLPDAMRNLAEAFDYAANACGLSLNDFGDAFLTSGLATAWEAGSPKVISGHSGTELVQECFTRAGLNRQWPPARIDPLDRTPEYWAGWVLAYAQHQTARPFADFIRDLPPNEIVALYHPLHEASEDTFVDRAESIIRRKRTDTQLARQRRITGFSQAELARRSGINIRNIQQYEQRAKNINHASAITLVSFGKALGCQPAQLLEF